MFDYSSPTANQEISVSAGVVLQYSLPAMGVQLIAM